MKPDQPDLFAKPRRKPAGKRRPERDTPPTARQFRAAVALYAPQPAKPDEPEAAE